MRGAQERLLAMLLSNPDAGEQFNDGRRASGPDDEYNGDTLQGTSEAQTTEPMRLGEFTDFFLKAWPLIDVLEMSFEGDREASLAFFSADSEFYPDFDGVCRQRVIERFRQPDEGDAED